MTWKRDPVKRSPMKWLGYDASGRRCAYVATTSDGWLWCAGLADGTDAAGFAESAAAAKRAAVKWLRIAA